MVHFVKVHPLTTARSFRCEYVGKGRQLAKRKMADDASLYASGTGQAVLT